LIIDRFPNEELLRSSVCAAASQVAAAFFACRPDLVQVFLARISGERRAARDISPLQEEALRLSSTFKTTPFDLDVRQGHH
jgi:hypothetical protein